jgi:hypothetical protein
VVDNVAVMRESVNVPPACFTTSFRALTCPVVKGRTGFALRLRTIEVKRFHFLFEVPDG